MLTDPRTLGEMPQIEMPEHFTINDNMIVKPAENPAEVEVVRGPNIKPFPLGKALEASYTGKVVLKTEDNITTDHILPAGAKLLPYLSLIHILPTRSVSCSMVSMLAKISGPVM